MDSTREALLSLSIRYLSEALSLIRRLVHAQVISIIPSIY